MQFSKLRLTGFKSFVDPTEIEIDDGLTGVVGPNGCGKSNLVEALRWVMGETSAKRMRGGEMDDVIFGGTTDRPSRNIAEVGLDIDNSARMAPAALNDSEELTVTRRIERAKGSHYRVNGRDVRARDVQLLFADAATGARSSGLVSQGRIGEIIAAKPAERRILLEEAANVRGLHSRRHEAELRLRAAESNLERLEDVLTALRAQLQGLRQQARQAARYRAVSEQIRRAESILLHRRWQERMEERGRAGSALAEAETIVVGLTETAANAATRQAEGTAGLPELRTAETEAAAELQRLTLARAELENEERRIATALSETETRQRQITDDVEREHALAEDARAALTRLDEEITAIKGSQQGEAEAQAAASETLAQINRAADSLEQRLAELTGEIATTEARRGELDRQIRRSEERIERLGHQSESLTQQRRSLEDDAVGPGEVEAAEAAVTAAGDAVEAERGRAEAAETARDLAGDTERAARVDVQTAEADRTRLQAETDALLGMLGDSDADDDGAPVLDAIAVEPGYETALAAALGDDLSAPVDTGSDVPADVSWHKVNGDAGAMALPDDLVPLATYVQAPAVLSRRLARIAIASNAETATRLQASLGPGERLVTREGGLWRWDGLVVAPGAPSAAAVRMKQRNRLAEIQRDLAEQSTASEQAQEVLSSAEENHRAAVEAEKSVRTAQRHAVDEADRARARQAELSARLAEFRSKLDALEDARERIAAEVVELEEARESAAAGMTELADVEAMRAESSDKRHMLAERRTELAEARSEHDRLMREAEARRMRLSAIEGEKQSWADRNERAAARMADLQARQTAEASEIERLRARPGEIVEQREKLAELTRNSEARRQQAADALATAETQAASAERDLREAEHNLAEARETRIRAEAALEHINQAVSTLRERISERLQCTPDEILAKAEIGEDEKLPEPDDVEAKLGRLTAERERIGPVNLRAEQEVEELEQQVAGMESERDDLIGAIARLRGAIQALNREARERLLESFKKVDAHFQDLFVKLFGGGQAHLTLVEGDDPLEAGIEIMASPPGKKLQLMSLLSGGEQALTALALVFAAFLTNPSPICVLDEVDAPLDDSNVDRFCQLLEEINRATGTRFLIITHHRMTMARMDRLFGVTMAEQGISQLVSVDLEQAERLRDSA
ncbi:MAG: chromosome segregation protein SMC [Rhodospirillaceae bacterium]|nr:chromosome segregation protein SMC [Rhodospirillaceae bacterium]